MEGNEKDIRKKDKFMYRIKTTDILSNNILDKELMNMKFIETISDDFFISKFHNLYVVYSLKYKIEFSFYKDEKIYYIMIENNNLSKRIQNSKIEFIDDFLIFEKDEKIIKNHLGIKSNDDIITVGNSELHFFEGKIDSLYYFPIGVSI
jgi:hypothetical protein